NLIPELLDKMDEGKIAFSVGVELSYLDESLQRSLLSDMEALDCTPSNAQAVRMHKEHSAGQLREDRIGELLSEPKPNQKETLRFPVDALRRFAPRLNERQLSDFVLKACDHYARYLKWQRDRDAR
ncbi:MAG: chromosome partitioning protein ParB, partial [Clostridia bacterium]|nr:chromosome partitioning protein ParB [Clostridia bacterium]